MEETQEMTEEDLEAENPDAESVAARKPLNKKEIKSQRRWNAMGQNVADQVSEKINREIANTKAIEERLAQLEQKYVDLDARSAAPAEPTSAAAQVSRILQQAKLETDPESLRLLRQARGRGPQEELKLLGDLAELALRRMEKPAAKASAVVLPSGGGLPALDLRAEYGRRVQALRPGDVAGLAEVKREFRKKGLEVW